MFWQYQIEFYESLAHKAWALKGQCLSHFNWNPSSGSDPGYAVATYVLLVVLVLVTLLLGAVIVHYRRKNLNNEKALHTRSATLSHETHLKIIGCTIFCCK